MGFLSGFAFEGCSVTYVYFPGNHVCNQPGAVLLHELDLAAWRRFGEWASARGLQTLPAEPATLLLHLQDLAGKGKATSTIRTAASAVSAAHRAAGFSGGNPSAHEDVKDFLRGVEREAPPQRQVAAMTSSPATAGGLGWPG